MFSSVTRMVFNSCKNYLSSKFGSGMDSSSTAGQATMFLFLPVDNVLHLYRCSITDGQETVF